jgi:type IV pilus assembly protein PilC
MGMMLGRIGEYLAKERRTARQVRAAIAYPMVMMCIAAVLSVFLVLVILPRFAAIYESRAAQLPGPTRVLLAISDFLTQQWAYWVPGVVIALVTFFLFRRTGAGRRTEDWLRLHVPVLRSMYAQLYVTRAARTMATLFGAGVNLLDIIDICRGVTSNVYYLEMWDNMERGVRDGHQISDAVNDSRLVPPNVASMIASGERSGRLSDVMGRIAQFSEEELEASVKQATSFIEPAMIIIMGVIIGAVAMALLLPIFSLGNIMSGGG